MMANAVIALTCCERLGNVGYWSFTSVRIAVKQVAPIPTADASQATPNGRDGSK